MRNIFNCFLFIRVLIPTSIFLASSFTLPVSAEQVTSPQKGEVQAQHSGLSIPNLPEGVANNSVAKVLVQNETYLLSFMGLGEAKDHHAVHNKAWAYKVGDANWLAIKPVPSSIEPIGRLASTAVGVEEFAYLFGGYTVDANHTEISSPDVYRYDVVNNEYKQLAPMPVPVDDSVALVYQNRYIYLVSGWHNDGNVNLVQVYDILNDSWLQASPFLGEPVFGQAGAIWHETIVVCDGVIVEPHPDKRRTFAGKAQCLIGEINENDVSKIDWRTLIHPTGKSRYRMAATAHNGQLIFVGGSDNPYNYNGIGYNGVPSVPDPKVWLFDVAKQQWKIHNNPTPSMDHRGMLKLNEKMLLVIGGMEQHQKVSDRVFVYRVN